MTRRTVLRHAATGSAALALGGSVPGWARKRAPLARRADFPSGVAAGFPTQHSVILWTRLAEERETLVGFEIARDPDFDRVVRNGTVRTSDRRDLTAKLAVGGLEPGERYHYRFTTADGSSAVGRFSTLRPPDSREPVRIGFFSCQGWQPGYYTAHAGLAEEDLDLTLSLGDYIYERTDDDGPRTDAIGPNGDGEAQTLPEYRQKYHLYQGDPNLQAMHAAHAFACVWDDHEMESGWRGAHPGETQGIPRRVPYERRRDNGRRAFFEHLPIPRMKEAPNRIYRSIPLGAAAELFLLDLHSYGRAPACGFAIPPRPCPEARDPSVSMLGARQKRWLKRGLARSRSTWKLLANSLMMMSLDLYPGQSFNWGQWDGFHVEREELMSHLLREQIGGVAALSGDIHTFFAGSVSTDGRESGTAAATEFVGGSISSEGIAQGVAEALGLPEDSDVAPLVTERITAVNPHIDYANTVRRGYGVLEASGDELRVDFRGPVTVYEPTSEIRTWASFSVSPESPRVELL